MIVVLNFAKKQSNLEWTPDANTLINNSIDSLIIKGGLAPLRFKISLEWCQENGKVNVYEFKTKINYDVSEGN